MTYLTNCQSTFQGTIIVEYSPYFTVPKDAIEIPVINEKGYEFGSGGTMPVKLTGFGGGPGGLPLELLSEDWYDGTVESWSAITSRSYVEQRGEDGNPDGYLYSAVTRTDGYYAGAKSYGSNYSDNLLEKIIRAVHFDYIFIDGTCYRGYLRFRYKDYSHNGWKFPFVHYPAKHKWLEASVYFNPNWTDDEAKAAGWIQEPYSPSFSETMSNVYYTEVRFYGSGWLAIGLDNFSVCFGEGCAPELIGIESPDDLIIKRATAARIELNWKRVEHAEYYTVYRNGQYLAVAPFTRWLDSAVEPETNYEYQVSANVGDYETDLSNFVTVATPAPAPDLVTAALWFRNITPTHAYYCYEIKNIGTAVAYLDGPTDETWDNVSIQAYLSSDEEFGDGGDIPAGGRILGLSPLGYIYPEGSFSGCSSTSISDRDLTITPYLTLMVDWGERVQEEDESNNTAASLISTNLDRDIQVVRVYEDAEDGSIRRWTVYPYDGTIGNIYDQERLSRVIRLSGEGTHHYFRLYQDDLSYWYDQNRFFISFSLKYTEYFKIYVSVETTEGRRYLVYRPYSYDSLNGSTYLYYGLGASALNGIWQEFVRDLQADLDRAQPQNSVNQPYFQISNPK